MSDYIDHKVWDEIIVPAVNITGSTVIEEVISTHVL